MNPIPCSKAHGIAKLGGALLLLFTLAPLASAELAVNWGGKYTTAAYGPTNPNKFRLGDGSPFLFGGFDVDGNPLLLIPETGYNSGATSAVFYGAVSSNVTSTAMLPGIYNNSNASNPDEIQLKGPTSSNTSAYLVMWKQEDFLDGLNTGNVGFTSTDTVVLDLTTYAAFQPGRIALRQGSSYYVSQTVFNAANTIFTLNPTELNWFNYNPAVDGLFTIGSAATIVSNGQIATVTEIGFLFTDSTSAANAARIRNFDVTLTAIPEPAAAGVLLGGFGLLVVLRRRFRR